MSLADVVDSYTPRVERVKVCPRNDLVTELEAVVAQLGTVRDSGSIADGDSNLYRERDRLRAEIADAQVEFVFRSLPRLRWTELLGKHPPKEAHRLAGADHNPETFPRAAVAASLVSPRGETDADTERLVRRIFEEWPIGETERLWKTCLSANHGVSQVPKSWSGSGTTGPSVTRSEPPSASESLSPPS